MDPRLVKIGEQMGKMTAEQRAQVIVQCSTHACDMVLAIAKSVLNHKQFRRLQEAVKKARGGPL